MDILVLPGGDIGPEITAAALGVLGPCGMTDYPPREQGAINAPGTIRNCLDPYANVRPALADAAPAVEAAVDAVLADSPATADLRGTSGTRAVAARIEASAEPLARSG